MRGCFLVKLCLIAILLHGLFKKKSTWVVHGFQDFLYGILLEFARAAH